MNKISFYFHLFSFHMVSRTSRHPKQTPNKHKTHQVFQMQGLYSNPILSTCRNMRAGRERERECTREAQRKRKAKWGKGDWGESGRGGRIEPRKLQRKRGSCRALSWELCLPKLWRGPPVQRLSGSSEFQLQLSTQRETSIFGEERESWKFLRLVRRTWEMLSSPVPYIRPTA